MSEPERAIRQYVERERGDVLDGIEACGVAVADSLGEDRIEDGAAIRTRLRAALERTGLLQRLSNLLVTSAAVAGFGLPAKPVAGPPYVVVTSRGPILRATVDPGRLVIRFDAFDVDPQSGVYQRLDGVDLHVTLH